MADELLIVVAVVALMPFWFIGFALYRRWGKRNHVWVELDLRNGRTTWQLVRPTQNGRVSVRGASYRIIAGAATQYNGSKFISNYKPLFRYKEGDPRPIVFKAQKFVAKTPIEMTSTNPGETVSYKAGDLVEIPMAKHETIPAEAEEVFFKQHLFSDAYAGRPSLVIMALIGGLTLLVGFVIGSYVK